MPRSFLVKKYFTSKRPNYSELECQNGEFGSLLKKSNRSKRKMIFKSVQLASKFVILIKVPRGLHLCRRYIGHITITLNINSFNNKI